MAIPAEQICYSRCDDMKQVSWTMHDKRAPLVEALEQLSDVCDGYIPKKSTFPVLKEYPEKGLTGDNQIVLLDKDEELVAIIDLGAGDKMPTLDCINATSADFYALLDFINKRKVVNIKRNQTLRILLRRIPT